MKKYVLAAFVFAVAFTFAVGCAPKKKEVEIEGTATIDGTPIDLGIVQFFNDKSEGGGNVQEGRYTAKVPTGELTVRISGYQYTGPMPEVPEPAPGAPPSAPPQRPRKAITPEDMWQKPTMKITVNKGGTYDLEFKSEK